jgi:holo-[acyl-carrier protein] synthase
MIIGIGSDLVDIRRIRKSIDRHGARFVERIFTEIEQATANRRGERVASFAKRFAAKEACAKALGCGIAEGVFWRDMGVVNLPGGKPTLHLTNGAAERLQTLLPPSHHAVIHLSITDEFPMAQAFVVIEARPIG